MDGSTNGGSSPSSNTANIDHLAEQLSPSTRLVLILLCLTAALCIAYFQVIHSRRQSIELRDEPTRVEHIWKMTRLVLLNTVSGILLMMATTIGAHDARLAGPGSDLHSLLDPHMASVKIDCFRVHAINWVRYSSGWKILENLARHAHELHLSALPLEMICAMFAFIAVVMLDGRTSRKKVLLLLSALGHLSFPSQWAGWAIFASLLIAYLDEQRNYRGPLLPFYEHKRKTSETVMAPLGAKFGEKGRRMVIIGLALFLLSAKFYGEHIRYHDPLLN